MRDEHQLGAGAVGLGTASFGSASIARSERATCRILLANKGVRYEVDCGAIQYIKRKITHICQLFIPDFGDLNTILTGRAGSCRMKYPSVVDIRIAIGAAAWSHRRDGNRPHWSATWGRFCIAMRTAAVSTVADVNRLDVVKNEEPQEGLWG